MKKWIGLLVFGLFSVSAFARPNFPQPTVETCRGLLANGKNLTIVISRNECAGCDGRKSLQISSDGKLYASFADQEIQEGLSPDVPDAGLLIADQPYAQVKVTTPAKQNPAVPVIRVSVTANIKSPQGVTLLGIRNFNMNCTL